MSDSVTIQNSDGETFAELIDIIGVSEVKKAFQQSVKEGSLHKWFKGSKSKDGKPGWVNVVTGGTVQVINLVKVHLNVYHHQNVLV